MFYGLGFYFIIFFYPQQKLINLSSNLAYKAAVGKKN
jgi:hypothetical protein